MVCKKIITKLETNTKSQVPGYKTRQYKTHSGGGLTNLNGVRGGFGVSGPRTRVPD